MNLGALEVLKGRAKVRHIKSGYIFFNPEGKPVNVWTLISAYRSSIKKAGLSPLRFHDLTRMIFSPRNLKYIRAFDEACQDKTVVQETLAQIPCYDNITK